MKKAFSFGLIILICFSFCGCGFLGDVADMANNDEAVAKVFDLDGISIELTSDFLRMDFVNEDFDFIVGTEYLTVMGIKVDDDGSGIIDYSVLEFAEQFRSLLESDEPSEITVTDGIPTFQYRSVSDDVDQTNAVMFYKGSDCFWTVSFITNTDVFDGTYDEILKYAKTVKCD